MKSRVFVIVIIILLPYLQISQKPFKWKELFHCFHSMKLTGDSNTFLTYRCIYVRVPVYTQTCTQTHKSDQNEVLNTFNFFKKNRLQKEYFCYSHFIPKIFWSNLFRELFKRSSKVLNINQGRSATTEVITLF